MRIITLAHTCIDYLRRNSTHYNETQGTLAIGEALSPFHPDTLGHLITTENVSAITTKLFLETLDL